MSKHTPGPWQVVDEIFVDGPDGLGIFGGASTRRPDEENAANAHLIAAAPDLLEAARAILPELEASPCPPSDAEKRLRQAIQKAEGKTTT